MDKYEYQLKTEHIKQVAARKEYDEAAKLCATIDWTKIRDVKMLTLVSNIYEEVGQYEDAIDVLQQAYQYTTMGRRIAYRLTELALKADSYEDAKNYFEEFCRIAPNDQGRYILLYKMARSQKATLEEKIIILEAYKREDFDEKWAYELAVLYAMNNQKSKCVQLCDDIILWFGLGKYVDKALKLKAQFAPLTAAQKAKAEQIARKQKEEETLIISRTNLEEEAEPEYDSAQAEAQMLSHAMEEELSGKNAGKADSAAYADFRRAQEPEVNIPDTRQKESRKTDIVSGQGQPVAERRPEVKKQPEEKKYSSVVTSDLKTILKVINQSKLRDAGLLKEEDSSEKSAAKDVHSAPYAVKENRSAQPVNRKAQAPAQTVPERNVQQEPLRDEFAEAFAQVQQEIHQAEAMYEQVSSRIADAEAREALKASEEAEDGTGAAVTEAQPEEFAAWEKTDAIEIYTEQEEICEESAELEAAQTDEEESGSEESCGESEETGAEEASEETVSGESYEEKSEETAFAQACEEQQETESEEACEDSEKTVSENKEEVCEESEETAPGESYEEKTEETAFAQACEEQQETGSEEAYEESEETASEEQEEVYEDFDETVTAEVYEEQEEAEQEEAYEESEKAASESLDSIRLDGILNGRTDKMPPVNPEDISNVWHFAIQVPLDEDDIEMALDYLEDLAACSNRPIPKSVVKITGEKLNQKGLINSLDKLFGKTILVENAGDMNARVIGEFCKILDPSDRSLLVVFIDTPASLKRLFANNPAFGNKITAQFIQENYSAGELMEYAKKYADSEDSILDQSGELALMEQLKVIAENKEHDKKRIVEIIINNAIEKAEKKSVRKLFQMKYNKEGCLILRGKDFEAEAK